MSQIHFIEAVTTNCQFDGHLLHREMCKTLALNGLGRVTQARNLVEVCLNLTAQEGNRRVFLDDCELIRALIRSGLRVQSWLSFKKAFAEKLLGESS